MSFGLDDKILKNIINQFQKRDEVIRAVIFGSRARGDYRYNSDIDIAVYCKGEMPVGLYKDIDMATGIYKVNLVDMSCTIKKELIENIERDGIEIYSLYNNKEA